MQAIFAEAIAIFRDRLMIDEERDKFNVISRNYLKSNANESVYFVPKLKANGIYLETMDYNQWSQKIQKLVNQCRKYCVLT